MSFKFRPWNISRSKNIWWARYVVVSERPKRIAECLKVVRKGQTNTLTTLHAVGLAYMKKKQRKASFESNNQSDPFISLKGQRFKSWKNTAPVSVSTLLWYINTVLHNSTGHHNKRNNIITILKTITSFLACSRGGTSHSEVASRTLWADSVSGAVVLLVGYQWRSEVFKGPRWLLVWETALLVLLDNLFFICIQLRIATSKGARIEGWTDGWETEMYNVFVR